MTLGNYKKILILGSPGSGKSTLATILQKDLSIPLFRMDDLYWQENWTRPDELYFLTNLEEIVKTESWIIEGNYTRYLDARLKNADLVIFLENSTLINLFRVMKRSLARILGDKSTLPINVRNNYRNRIQINIRFFKLIYNFNSKSKPIILEKVKNKQITLIIIRNDKFHSFKI